MSPELYEAFLDWLRRQDAIVLRLEDGTVLATGFPPRTEFEAHDFAYRSSARVFQTLGYVRKQHGTAAVDAFLAQVRAHEEVGDA